MINHGQGRLLKGTSSLQQEQFQQIPRWLSVQSLKPTTFSVSSNSRLSLWTDYRHREDKHFIAVSSPTVGQKECSQEAGAGSSGGGEHGASSENGAHRQSRAGRGLMKSAWMDTVIPTMHPCQSWVKHIEAQPSPQSSSGLPVLTVLLWQLLIFQSQNPTSLTQKIELTLLYLISSILKLWSWEEGQVKPLVAIPTCLVNWRSISSNKSYRFRAWTDVDVVEGLILDNRTAWFWKEQRFVTNYRVSRFYAWYIHIIRPFRGEGGLQITIFDLFIATILIIG